MKVNLKERMLIPPSRIHQNRLETLAAWIDQGIPHSEIRKLAKRLGWGITKERLRQLINETVTEFFVVEEGIIRRSARGTEGKLLEPEPGK